MLKRAMLVVTVLIIVGAGALVAYKALALPNRVIVRNSSGRTLDSVHLTLRSTDGIQTQERDIPSLEPDREVVVRHGMNDSSLDVVFRRSGKEYKYSEPYIDLWRGEGWVIDVQPDGTVKSGYESIMKSGVRNDTEEPTS